MKTIVNFLGNLAFIGGTTAKNNTYTSEPRTLTIDTTKNELRIHDGVTLGGVVANQNAATAVKLLTARNINGVSFDGSSDITISAIDTTTRTTVTTLANSAGAANGLATLDATTHIPLTQIPTSVSGALSYQGVWDASLNSPALVSGSGTVGNFYSVSTAGSSNGGDSSYSNVALLLHGEGTNGQTTFTDNASTQKVVTGVGGAQISTAISKFGSGSILLNGTSQYLTVPSSTDFDFGTGDLTVEFFYYPTTITGTAVLIGRQEANAGFAFQVTRANAVPTFTTRGQGGVGLVSISGGTFTINTWHHVAVTRNGSNLYMFLNGTLVASGTSSANLTPSVARPLTIGALDDTIISFYAGGYFDEVRVTKGIARYTANFPTLTLAFSNSVSGGTVYAIGDRVGYDGSTWIKLSGNPSGVTSVNGRYGVVTLTAADVGLSSISANALNSATTAVNVSSSIAPTTGQVLTAISSTSAIWQTPAAASTTPTVSNKTAAYTVVTADKGNIIQTVLNAGAITLPSCATVGIGFSFTYINISTTTPFTAVPVNVVGTDTFNNTAVSYAVPCGGSITLTCTDASATGKWKITATEYGGLLPNAVSIGSGVVNSGNAGIAIGGGATVQAANGVAIGRLAIAASGAVAIGPTTYATGLNSSAFSGGAASGNYSIALGYSTIAGTNYSVAIGNSSVSGGSCAVASGATALGGSYAAGVDSFAAANVDNSSTYGALGNNSIAIGLKTKAFGVGGVSLGMYSSAGTITGKYAYASGFLTTSGDAQYGKLVLRSSTPGNVSVALTSDGAVQSTTNQLILPNDSSFTFTGSLIARNAATDTDSKAWTFTGAIRRGTNAATAAFIGVPMVNVVGSDGSAWTIALTADTNYGGLMVTATGEAGKTIKWVCVIDTVEVTG